MKSFSTQRQLKVGEEVRHALSSLFMKGKIYHPDLNNIESITVSEVVVSRDLRNAVIFVICLDVYNTESYISLLNNISKEIRFDLTRIINLKYSPNICFKKDRSHENAKNIDALISNFE